MGKKVIINLNQQLEKNNLTLQELALLTDIPLVKLSKLANQEAKKLSIDHLTKIVQTLNIVNMKDLIILEESEK